MRRLMLLAVATTLVVLGGCGDDDTDKGAATPIEAADTSTSTVVGGEEPVADGDYEPVSDVAAHAAIGQDIAALKTAMDPATKGQPVDWASAGKIFEQGGASKKGDGSNRTLAGLVPKSETVTFVRDAIGGTGSSKGASDAIRRQRVDKGVSVLLAEKMDEELAAARTKMRARTLPSAREHPTTSTRRGPSSPRKATASPPPPRSGQLTSRGRAR